MCIRDRYQARHVRGIVVTNEGKDDDKAFLSRDGSLVRLLLTGTKAMCDRLVWTTSHPQLYLSADFDHSAFARPIDPRDVSIHTFSQVGDAYLYGALSDNIRQETQALYTATCRRILGASPGDPSRDQVLARQGETIARGHGTFTTSAGEVQYRYTCPSKVVMGVDTPKCYHAMPVALEEADLAEYAEFAGLTTSQAANVTFFVEPYTRVLTTTAAEAPCVPGLSPCLLYTSPSPRDS